MHAHITCFIFVCVLVLVFTLKVPVNIPVTATYCPKILKNKYYGLRHGQSESNVMGIISSSPLIGIPGHGLTKLGINQARKSATCLLDKIGRDNLNSVQYISSPFLRAKQTAEESIDAINNILSFESTEEEYKVYKFKEDMLIDEAIQERWFGTLDGEPLPEYNKVWPVDMENADNSDFNVESINQVISRVSKLIQNCEENNEGKSFVLCSHADTLQITQLYLCWTTQQPCDPRQFSSYRFKNGEVRQMLELPPPSPL